MAVAAVAGPLANQEGLAAEVVLEGMSTAVMALELGAGDPEGSHTPRHTAHAIQVVLSTACFLWLPRT